MSHTINEVTHEVTLVMDGLEVNIERCSFPTSDQPRFTDTTVTFSLFPVPNE